MQNIETMSEKDLKAERKVLRNLIKDGSGNITLEQANRLIQIQRTLSRINSIREGRAWE